LFFIVTESCKINVFSHKDVLIFKTLHDELKESYEYENQGTSFGAKLLSSAGKP
jgi:hypothetical protein